MIKKRNEERKKEILDNEITGSDSTVNEFYEANCFVDRIKPFITAKLFILISNGYYRNDTNIDTIFYLPLHDILLA